MFKGLSPRAHKILSQLAQEEGKKNGSDQLLPEHVLLAMLKMPDCLGCSVLSYLKLNTVTFQLMLEQAIPARGVTISFSDLPASRRLRTLVDLAAIESRTLKQDYVGSEHLLLAALHEEQSVTLSFFNRAGISLDYARKIASQVELTERSSASPVQPVQRVFNPPPQNQNAPHQQQGQKQQQSLLKEYSRDLTARAREGQIDPVIGRETEIQRIVQVLSRRTKNNPVLVGEPGVGKTAIVEGLARRIVEEKVPRNLLHKRLLTLDLASVIAGTKYRGEFEERMKRIMKEIAEQKDVLLFIDELHTLIGAGGAEGALDASNMLKPALSRGELQCIGATTIKEYRKYFERDAALERRFQMIQVEEPGENETRLILEGIKKQYEEYHSVEYEEGVIDAIVRYTRRYITERFLPDKAIDVLDEVGAMKKISSDSRPAELAELEASIAGLNEEKQQLVMNQNYERAAEIRDKVRSLRQKLDTLRQYWEQDQNGNLSRVTPADVCAVVSLMTGIPVDQTDLTEAAKLRDMEKQLHKTVIGQHEAISLIASAVRRSRAGVSSTRRPIGSFVFLGPTGVGKTLLAKTLARFLFGSEESLIRIDMSDYMEKHNSSRLIGAPPGYVGYEEGGVLTEKVRQNPYSVVLLDEIEKAHPDVFNLLLQVLEEGELRDSLGHTVNFRNTLIIMTSNAGARQISNDNRLGFNTFSGGVANYADIRASALNEFKKLLSPELINRIDDIVVFDALSREEVSLILDLQLSELRERLGERNMDLKIFKGAREYLIEHGYDPAFGARPMRRIIQRHIEDPVAYALVSGEAADTDQIQVDCKNGILSVTFRKKSKKTSKPARKKAVPVAETQEASVK